MKVFIRSAMLAASAWSTAHGQAVAPRACASATASEPVAQGTPRTGMQTRMVADSTRAAIRLFAAASADEITFVGSPKVCVQLTGDLQLDSLHVLARRNLASPVVSQTSYHNVYVAVEILGRLNAACIAGRITGQQRDSTTAAPCASLDSRSPAPSPVSPQRQP